MIPSDFLKLVEKKGMSTLTVQMPESLAQQLQDRKIFVNFVHFC